MSDKYDWDSLTPDGFELLMFNLLGKYGLKRRQIYSYGGHDKGRDIICFSVEEPLPGISFERKWVVQCKKRKKFPQKSEIDHEISSAKEHDPDYWLLCTTAKPTPSILDYLESYENKCGFRLIHWNEAHLEELMDQHSDIADKFFKLLPSYTVPEQPVTVSEQYRFTIEEKPGLEIEIAYDKEKDEVYEIVDVDAEIYESEVKNNPNKNLDGSKAAFVYPNNWEEIGNIFVLDLAEESEINEESLKRITNYDHPDQYTPKEVWWLDDEILLVIIGYAYGTVTVGGDLFAIDIETSKIVRVHECDKNEEVMSITLDDDCLTLTIAGHDYERMSYESREECLTVAEIRERIAERIAKTPYVGKWLPKESL